MNHMFDVKEKDTKKKKCSPNRPLNEMWHCLPTVLFTGPKVLTMSE